MNAHSNVQFDERLSRIDKDAAGGISLAARTARYIEQQLFLHGAEPGAVLASEKGLVHRLGVGHHSMREAIRILQFQGWVRMQRGARGGLVFSQPSFHNVVGRLFGRFLIEGVTEEHIRAARVVVAQASAALAMRRGETGTAWLNAMQASDNGEISPLETLRDSLRFGVRLAWAAGNPALDLFAFMLAASVEHRLAPRNAPHDSAETAWRLSQELAIARAMQERNAAACAEAIRHYFAKLDQPFGTFVTEPAGPLPKNNISRHQATRLAQQLVRSIAEQHLAAGAHLGSEESLCSAHDVPQATLQQALRIMESDGIVEVRRGRGRGVFVGQPDANAPLPMLRYHLRELDQARVAELVAVLCTQLGLHDDAQKENNALARQCEWLRNATSDNPILRLLAYTLSQWCTPD